MNGPLTRITTLPSGLRIVTEAMPGLASATVGLWVEAGSRHESEAECGIAHFLEHMAFKGTAIRNARQIAEAIEDVGGYINAFTSREMTAYYARVLADDVALGLDLLADILLNPAFAEAEIEVERGVILQEIGQALDTPDDIVFDWLQEAAYPRQPFGRAILGSTDTVRAFDRADFQSFTARHYRPEAMILAAAGAVDHDALVEQAARLFAPRPGALAPAALPARFEGGEFRMQKGLEQVHFTLGFEAPAQRAPDFFAAQIYATALGGGMSSRLFQELREDRGLCYSVFAQAAAHADTGMLTIYAGTGAEEAGELARLTVDAMRRAADEMSEAEVARARAQFRAGLLMGLESPSARADRMARLLSIWGHVPTPQETVARIDAVTLEDVRAFARHLCEGAPAAMALYGPAGGVPSLPALAERLAA
ncbi:MAG: insulinase family protein [Rhodobacteraceae bacterium]|nr:insulinase family protein [Paracoccaceae bacterium]